MFINYLKIAFRNFKKHRLTSLISIVSLTIGFTSCFLIFMWIQDEISYDKHHDKKDRIVKVDGNASFNDKNISLGTQTNYTGPMLHKDLPEIEDYVRVTALFNKSTVQSTQNLLFQENDVFYADNNFFDLFDMPFIEGNKSLALISPSSVVINKKMAIKYFPRQNALNKSININNKDYVITGIVEPGNMRTHLNFNFLLKQEPFSFQPEEFSNLNLAYLTYLLLNENANRLELTDKVSKLIRGYTLPVAQAVGLEDYIIKAKLTPLAKVYQSSYLESISTKIVGIKNGSSTNVYLMILVALIILVIASFNYINLNLARGLLRTKEICIRKMSGAGRKQIRNLIISESFITTLLVSGLSVIATELLLPFFNNMTGKELHLILLFKPVPLVILAGIIILLAYLSGFYPANEMAKTNPAFLQNKNFLTQLNNGSFRQIFIIIQFVFSILLLVSTFFMSDQIKFMNTKELGFNKSDKLVINITNVEDKDKCEILKQKLKNISGINSTSLSSAIPGVFEGENPFSIYGQENVNVCRMYFTDNEFIPTQGFELIRGRNFSNKMENNKNYAIINEQAAKLFNLNDPINATIQDQTDKSNYQIIGVVKDFHHRSLQEPIMPVIIRMTTDRWKPEYLIISIMENQISNIRPTIEKIFTKIIPNQPFVYFFYDNLFQTLYLKDKESLKVLTLASSMAIFLSCLGLFGLVTFIIQRKTKEIGIRKVFGASTFTMVKHLTLTFLYRIILANIIAWPLAYFYISNWLESYAYRISLGISNFIFAGFIVLIISIATIIAHVYRASVENPVNALKYE